MRAADLLSSLATPLALLVCLGAFAWAVDDPVSAAELGYLALLATAVLTALACLPERAPWVVEGTALLTAAAAIGLPTGDLRGATVALLLTACVAIEIGRAIGGWRGEAGEAPSWTLLVAAAVALQMLFRAERLLAPELDLRTLVALLALPAAGAIATGLLWRRFGPRAAIAAALLLALAPGWRVAPTLTLLALAAAAHLGRDRRLAVAALLATLAAASLWRPAFGALLLLAVAAVWARQRPRPGLAVAALAFGAALLPWAPGSWEEAVEAAAVWLLLVPFAALAERRRWPALTAALALAFASQRWLGGTAAVLAPAVAVAALVVRLPIAARRLQLLWSGFLVFGGALLACYPWLRPEPLGELLERLGAAPEPNLAVLVAAGAAVAALLLDRLGRSVSFVVARPESVGLLAIAAAILLALPGAAVTPLGQEIFVLDRDLPAREAAVDPPARVSEIVADTYLSNGIQVETDRAVARVTLTLETGEEIRWRLRAGANTGEWAVRRPDVAALPGVTAPPPWLSWVAPGGFFAQRYRARWRSQRPLRVSAVRVELAEGLPPDVAVTVFGLDLRR